MRPSFETIKMGNPMLNSFSKVLSSDFFNVFIIKATRKMFNNVENVAKVLSAKYFIQHVYYIIKFDFGMLKF
ncbi:hypothetical protein JCM8795_15330 [Hydrogenobaculum acidophilum]